MEANRQDQQNHIFSEGLRLVSQCKVPPSCSSVESDQLLQVQKEWARSLLQTLPPLLDWTERHRNTLFDGEECGPSATLEFQRCFVLVFLEQGMGSRVLGYQPNYYDDDAFDLIDRLLRFEEDVARILNKDTNTDLRSSLFHYYRSALGRQGWQGRPVELHSFYRLFCLLLMHPVVIPFWQGLMLFAVNIAKELLEFQQDFQHQKQGIDIMRIIMELPDSERSYSEDAEQILKMALGMSRQIANTLHNDRLDRLWNIIYRSLCSIRDVDPSLDDEVMQNLLALLIEHTSEKGSKLKDSGAFAFLRTMTLLLLLDVPDVEVTSFYFNEFTISGRLCDWHELLSYSRSHLQNVDPNNLRFSIDTRIRMGQLIPKLFSTSYFMRYLLFESSNLRLDLLTWMTMFPIGQTEQQKLDLGFMLKRLLDKIKKLCKELVEDRLHYVIDQQDVHHVYDTLRDLLPIISQGINELPALGQFRKLKWNLKKRMTATRVEMKRFKALVIGEDVDDEDQEEQDP